jgi:hypothetical protein
MCLKDGQFGTDASSNQGGDGHRLGLQIESQLPYQDRVDIGDAFPTQREDPSQITLHAQQEVYLMFHSPPQT